VVGSVVGGEVDRRPAVSAGIWATLGVGLIVVFDQFISAWSPGRTIATIGPQSPNLEGPFWYRMIDYAGHQILPSLSLALIGFATFMRFTRASMLETLKSDYVRTAKAKGLPGTQVIMRHAFRTALIPVMTVVTISIATIIEGAVITERVFAWKGMGSLFIEGLTNVDPYPVMGFLLITSIVIIFMNAVADIMYAYLDPRIRR
jgi:peptide/nickel transport system permease protein